MKAVTLCSIHFQAMKHAKDTANGMSVGELWLRLLRFYSIEFDTGGVVVSIKSSQAVPRNTKPWNCKKLAVEGTDFLISKHFPPPPPPKKKKKKKVKDPISS